MNAGGRDGPEEVELTPEEREGYERLPRERAPGDVLEERVVRALRERGFLSGGSRPEETGRFRGLPTWMAVAAGFLVFLVGGVAGGLAGHRIGASTATEALLAGRGQDAALRVQEAGTAYVRALVALEAMREAGREEMVGQGREAASVTLHAAAQVLERLDPSDPLLPVLTELLEERLREGVPDPARDGREVQQTIWF